MLANLLGIQGRISGVHPYDWLTGHNINLTPGTITNTVSMDQVAVKHLGATWLPSLALSHSGGISTSTLSRNSLGVDIPATANYREVFERLFPPADAGQLKEAKARIDLNRSILDTAVGSVKDLQRDLGRIDHKCLTLPTAVSRMLRFRSMRALASFNCPASAGDSRSNTSR